MSAYERLYKATYTKDAKVASVLIPTRGRSGLLISSVRLLMNLAAHPENVEVLLYVDDDDPVDYDEIWKKFAAKDAPPVAGKIIRGPRQGYKYLFRCFDALAAASTGRWCLIWNDDALMATPGWDEVLDKTPGDIAVAWTESNHGRSPCTFPFFTRSWYTHLGHVSLQTHNDTWLEEVSKEAGVNVDVPILVVHVCLDDHPEQYDKSTSEEYYTDEMKALRSRDAATLRGILDG